MMIAKLVQELSLCVSASGKCCVIRIIHCHLTCCFVTSGISHLHRSVNSAKNKSLSAHSEQCEFFCEHFEECSILCLVQSAYWEKYETCPLPSTRWSARRVFWFLCSLREVRTIVDLSSVKQCDPVSVTFGDPSPSCVCCLRQPFSLLRDPLVNLERRIRVDLCTWYNLGDWDQTNSIPTWSRHSFKLIIRYWSIILNPMHWSCRRNKRWSISSPQRKPLGESWKFRSQQQCLAKIQKKSSGETHRNIVKRKTRFSCKKMPTRAQDRGSKELYTHLIKNASL